MMKQTFNVIMACKGRFDLIQTTESFEGIEIKDSAYERVITYMAKECGLSEKDYNVEVMYNIMFDAVCDYIKTCSRLDEIFSRLKIYPLPGYEKKLTLRGTAERIADAFISVAMYDRNVCINGFEEYVKDIDEEKEHSNDT